MAMKISKNQSDPHRYDDILALPHHVSEKHPRMPLLDRAAQFAPFAALSGYGDAVKETVRFREERIAASEAGIPVWDDSDA